MGEAVYLLGFITLQRLAELWHAQRNTRSLLAGGAVQFGKDHYALIVAFHVAWLAGLWWLGHGRELHTGFLALFAALQVLRLWVLFSLGSRWTTRIIVLPGAPLVAKGLYRSLRHPNYIIVAMEIAVVPLALGLPLFAAIFSLLHVPLLMMRIKAESAALAWAAHYAGSSERQAAE